MAIPLIPIMTALAAGGSLVPHAAGGLIVSSATAGGYVAGTYLGTTAVTSIVAGALGTATAGTAILVRALQGARIFKTAAMGTSALTGTIGAGAVAVETTAIAGSVGAATAGTSALTFGAIAFPILAGSTLFISGYLYRLNRKLKNHKSNTEINFTATEAKVVEMMVKYLSKKVTT